MRTLVLSTAVLALTACGSGTGPESGSRVGLGFQLARTSTASAMLASGSASLDGTPYTGVPPTVAFTADGLRITRDADVIVITKAQLVVRDVKLKSAVAACLDDDDDGSAIRLGGSPDDDDCPEFRVGPFLVDLPVTGAAGARLSVPVPPGTYSSVRLRLHKVTSSDGADAAFRQANPDFRDISVRLQGTYNGTPFIFVNDVNAKLDVPLSAPFVVGSGGDEVTVLIDLSTWFLRPQGGLYAPALANTPGSVRSSVQNNIKNAFRAFRDRNRDGRED